VKLKAEARAQESSELEAEVRLNALFSELMVTANGRSGYVVSDKAIEYLLEKLKDVEVIREADSVRA
jgi:hypothetical protein